MLRLPVTRAIYTRMSHKKSSSRHLPAFTLQELLIVLVIMGILILLALPNLMPLISKTKSMEAQINLKHVYTLQRSYFLQYSKYNASLEELGFEHEKTIEENGNANYRIQIVSAENGSFLARATALVDFDGDGQFNVWEIDQYEQLREVTKD